MGCAGPYSLLRCLLRTTDCLLLTLRPPQVQIWDARTQNAPRCVGSMITDRRIELFGPQRHEREQEASLSRLEVTKQLFHALMVLVNYFKSTRPPLGGDEPGVAIEL